MCLEDTPACQSPKPQLLPPPITLPVSDSFLLLMSNFKFHFILTYFLPRQWSLIGVSGNPSLHHLYEEQNDAWKREWESTRKQQRRGTKHSWVRQESLLGLKVDLLPNLSKRADVTENREKGPVLIKAKCKLWSAWLRLMKPAARLVNFPNPQRHGRKTLTFTHWVVIKALYNQRKTERFPIKVHKPHCYSACSEPRALNTHSNQISL